ESGRGRVSTVRRPCTHILAVAIVALTVRPAVGRPDPPRGCPGPGAVMSGPVLSDGGPPVRLPPADPGPADQPLPINLATALRLADARPLVIEAAQASVQVAASQLERAGALWLPSLYAGVDYYRHDGGAQLVQTGELV